MKKYQPLLRDLERDIFLDFQKFVEYNELVNSSITSHFNEIMRNGYVDTITLKQFTNKLNSSSVLFVSSYVESRLLELCESGAHHFGTNLNVFLKRKGLAKTNIEKYLQFIFNENLKLNTPIDELVGTLQNFKCVMKVRNVIAHNLKIGLLIWEKYFISSNETRSAEELRQDVLFKKRLNGCSKELLEQITYDGAFQIEITQEVYAILSLYSYDFVIEVVDLAKKYSIEEKSNIN